MINARERLAAKMSVLPTADVCAAVAAWAELRHMTTDGVTHAMIGAGWEVVDADEDAVTLQDGREVLRIMGVAYALPIGTHRTRLAAAFEAAKQARPKPEPEPETKSVVGTESLSRMICPECGDSLQHTAVCPKCAAGKLGYRHRYTCVCGGVDLVSKEAL